MALSFSWKIQFSSLFLCHTVSTVNILSVIFSILISNSLVSIQLNTLNLFKNSIKKLSILAHAILFATKMSLPPYFRFALGEFCDATGLTDNWQLNEVRT